MKKWLMAAAVLAAAAFLTRLPHPSRDIARLEPVEVVYVYREGETLCMETDTGAGGSGRDLEEAAADMREKASGEIFLDTAEFLILDPAVEITEEYGTLLRPDCKVLTMTATPDLEKAAAYLRVHPPEMTLIQLRARSIPH